MFGAMRRNISFVFPRRRGPRATAAARWLKLDPDTRERTGLMAPSHALRVEINGYILERLVRDGAIHGPRLEAERLVSVGYTKVEKMLAGNYSPGDVVSFHRAFKSLGVEKGDERRVTVVDDRVKFRLEDGCSLTLRHGDARLRHLDQVWASTVHAFQGRTVDNVIAVMDSRHPHLSTQKSFYVEISRARHRADLVTDNAEALREHLESATGERVAALEGIRTEVERAAERAESGVLDRLFGREDGLGMSHPPVEKEADKPADPAPEKTPEPKQIGFGLEL